MSFSREDGRNRREEDIVDVERGVSSPTSGSDGTVQFGTSAGSARAQPGQMLHRVPPEIREKNKHFYDPTFVALGPYHHGQPQFRQGEGFKDEVLNIILNSKNDADDDRRLLFCTTMLEDMDKIRSFYGGLPRDKCDDEELAEMMLRDACLVLYCMKLLTEDSEAGKHMIESIGLFRCQLLAQDILKLENQIPLWVVVLMIEFTEGHEGEELVRTYFSWASFGDSKGLKRVPWKVGTDNEPLHLLDAIRAVRLQRHEKGRKEELYDPSKSLRWGFVKNFIKATFKFRWSRKRKTSPGSFLEQQWYPFRSATQLKAKGIYFRPSSRCYDDIRFSSYYFYGKLYLPILIVNNQATKNFANLIALEMSPTLPDPETSFIVTSYVNFMKSLIQNPNDVKELEENGILLTRSLDNEQIVRIFKEIDTFGVDNMFIFNDVKIRINDHCNSKTKTWIAELINTYFRSPWTLTTLIAATALLCLTFLQTYYTMDSRNLGN